VASLATANLGKGQAWNIEICKNESESQYFKPNPFRDGVLKKAGSKDGRN
jgi:hypothetical protein